jgi:hypothetical protein
MFVINLINLIQDPVDSALDGVDNLARSGRKLLASTDDYWHLLVLSVLHRDTLVIDLASVRFDAFQKEQVLLFLAMLGK